MITKIVLTGGPCAGKTTTNERIEEFFSKLGYAVFSLPEAATLFIKAGANFLTEDKHLYFEIHRSMLLFLLQMEESFEEIAKATGKPALIVNDRGAMDLSAYMDPEDWQNLVKSVGKTEEELLSRYKAVFHLCTSAKGAPHSYTLSNNSARMEESLDEAIQVDDNLMRVWKKHPNLHIIKSEEFVKDKIDNVLRGIAMELGITEPIETGLSED
ncbi:MAG: ATP-binding protein [Bacteroidales bacterium]|nr:ATP-binding protein [Bacteroidales bacterium]